nr:FHA domain-containing protein [Tumebacillus amylolyticus]
METDETVVGRATQHEVPDIAFANVFVSRRHLLIQNVNGRAVLQDLGSKTGTFIGDRKLTPHTPYELQNLDIIRLAGGMVSLRFSSELTDMTMELDINALPLDDINDLRIDREKRVCWIGSECVTMSDKEWRLFLMLYEHAATLVTFEEIKRIVWPERTPDDDGVPDVGNDELSSLVYRIRKKLHQSRYTISTVRGTGFIFELKE